MGVFVCPRKRVAIHAECVSAIARNSGLQRFSVRGFDKARSVLLWCALVHNLMQMVELSPGLVGGLSYKRHKEL